MTPLILLFGLGVFLALMFLFFFLIAPASPQSAMLEQVTRQPRKTRADRMGSASEPLRSAMYV